MNRTKSLVFLAVGAILQMAPSLTAQQQMFKAKVPFEFSAGGKTLPAGDYQISRHGAFLQLEDRNSDAASVVITASGDPSKDDRVRLVFDRVNNQQFLRGVVAPASLGSIELAVSSAEKRAKVAERQLAVANPSAEPVQTVITGAQ